MYINTYIIAVPEARKVEYLKIASVFAEVARDYGAIEIRENWEQEIPDGDNTDYRKAVKAEPGEKIVSSWVIWPDREAAAKAHKGMYEDPRLMDMGDMPFDGTRMILGGFEPLLAWCKDDA